MKNAQLKKPSTVLASLLIGLASIMAVCVPSLILITRTRAARAATTITVTTTSDSGAGSLRQAIAAAGSGDMINFNLPAPAKIVLTSGELVINSSITISGPGADKLVVSGNNNSRIFSIGSAATATISGLTVADGNGAGADESGKGGAVLSDGSFVMNSCVIANCSAEFGGGISLGPLAPLSLSGCTLWGNRTTGSGIAGLIVTPDGGAPDTTMTNCTVSGNSGFTTISTGGAVSLTNCTIAGNQTNVGLNAEISSLTLNNCIVAGNGKDIISTSDVMGNNNLIQNPFTAAFSGSGNITGQDPLLRPLRMNGGPTPTMELGCNSPALNAGSNTGASSLTTDQRGAPRIAGATVDIGAVEMQNQVTNNNDSGAGSLRDAITNATSGELIDISPCVTGTITLTSGEIVVGNNVTINGPGADVLTVSGNNASRIFDIESSDAEINGLTITHGTGAGANLSGQGGAILVISSLTMNECVVSNNSASFAGGLFVVFGTLTMNGCTISGNQTTNGAGGIGGNLEATLEMTNCTVSGNQTTGNAGAGGLNGAMVLTNCTVSGNTGSIGGGIVNFVGSVTINNCIVSGNNGGDLGANVTGNNNLVGTVVSGSFTGSNNITGVDPKLGPLQNNGGPSPTMAPLPGSPAIDAGSNLYSPVTDQRGSARPIDGDGDGSAVADIGAYEASSCSVTTLTVSTQPQSQAVCAGATATFTAATTGGGAGINPQWKISTDHGMTFTNIPGATGQTLTVPGVTALQSGNQYIAVFSNLCHTATTSVATLTVDTAPIVTANPASQSVAASSVSFTAAASGIPAPTVQWQVSTNGGTTFTNIGAATNTTLTFTPTPAQSGYRYRAVFTNTCGTATTSAAALTDYDTCIQDNTSKNVLQVNTTTGQYRFIRCSDGLTFTGTGQLVNQSGVLKLTDHQPGWVISATFNTGQRTGNATIQLITAPGLSQTITITDTNPANTCGCGG